jgi:hypothetical protein
VALAVLRTPYSNCEPHPQQHDAALQDLMYRMLSARLITNHLLPAAAVTPLQVLG